MTIKLIGLIIGILVLGTDIYYLVQEKHDPESKKIYTALSAAGAVSLNQGRCLRTAALSVSKIFFAPLSKFSEL